MPMHYIYPDNEVRRSFNPQTALPYHKQPATKYWLRHFDSLLYLTFLVQNETDRNNRAQATKELGICEGKMNYWKRHPNWDAAEAGREAEKLRQMWKGKPYDGTDSKKGGR